MKLYHATTRQRVAAIQSQGLLVRYADQSKAIKGIWLHTRSKSAWAVLHTIRRHHATLEYVVVLEVEVSRSQLTRFQTGLWYTVNDIPASALGKVLAGSTFGASAQ